MSNFLRIQRTKNYSNWLMLIFDKSYSKNKKLDVLWDTVHNDSTREFRIFSRSVLNFCSPACYTQAVLRASSSPPTPPLRCRYAKSSFWASKEGCETSRNLSHLNHVKYTRVRRRTQRRRLLDDFTTLRTSTRIKSTNIKRLEFRSLYHGHSSSAVRIGTCDRTNILLVLYFDHNWA